MLSEEALVFSAALMACGFLVLGCLDLVWPARPRRSLRYPPPGLRARAVAAAIGDGALARFRGGPPPWPASDTDAQAPGLERALALQTEGRIDDALVVAAAELERRGPATPDSPDEARAALWSIVGLGRQAADDPDGACGALETAIAFAPDDARTLHEQRLRTLVLAVARSLRAESAGEKAVRSLRGALAWIDRGLAAAGADAELEGAREEVSDRLWEVYEQAARTLAAEGDTEGARRLAEEALADPDVPASAAARLTDVLTSFVSEEIVHLTANALLAGPEVSPEETVAALRRVETLLTALPSSALAADRRVEIDRRLWWGYVRVARRLVDAGDFQAALVPLARAHALRPAAAVEGRNEARALLLRAVDGLVSTCADAVVRLAEAGDRAAAEANRQRLQAVVSRAASAGASGADFEDTVGKVERLLQDVETPSRS